MPLCKVAVHDRIGPRPEVTTHSVYGKAADAETLKARAGSLSFGGLRWFLKVSLRLSALYHALPGLV